jgi:RNA polymerase sigma-70 factor (ECF subfamily)
MVNFRMDRRLVGRIDPEDVLQEAYLAAVARVKHYDSAAAASPFVWLRMIVLQTLTDLHRHHLGAQRRDADREIALRGHYGSQSTSVSLAAQLVGRFTSPSQAAAYEETLAKVEQAIATMDPLDQEILAMRHFEELSNSEAAEVLGIQQSTASMRYVRAVKRLRVLLSTMPGFEGYANV